VAGQGGSDVAYTDDRGCRSGVLFSGRVSHRPAPRVSVQVPDLA
jgi:hypothetical protein